MDIRGGDLPMERRIDDCMKAHPLLHMVLGIGIGLLLIVILPHLAPQALMLGAACVLAAVIGEIVFLGGASKYHKSKR